MQHRAYLGPSMSSTSVQESAPSADGVNVDLDAGYLWFSRASHAWICIRISNDKSNHNNNGNNMSQS